MHRTAKKPCPAGEQDAFRLTGRFFSLELIARRTALSGAILISVSPVAASTR